MAITLDPKESKRQADEEIRAAGGAVIGPAAAGRKFKGALETAGDIAHFSLDAIRAIPKLRLYPSEVFRQAAILVVSSGLIIWLMEFVIGLQCGIEANYTLKQVGAPLYSGIFTAWCGIPDASVPALLAREEFDAVAMDMQHGSIDFAAALQAVPLIAAYDGFFGPGTGSFFMMGFVLLAGYGVLKATAHTKMLNFASNIGSLVVFIPSGAMWWAVGLAMAAAQVAGASLGARLAMRVGARLIKPLLVVTSTAMALRLLWQAFG